MTQNTIGFRSAGELAGMIRDREISSAELTEYFIRRIEKFDGKLNAVVIRDFDRARAAAKEADRKLSRGEKIGRLHGVPMTIKESYNIDGLVFVEPGITLTIQPGALMPHQPRATGGWRSSRAARVRAVGPPAPSRRG